MSKLGVLVVGPGWVAGEHINAFIKDPRTEIRSIVGRSSKSRDRAFEYLKNYKHKWSYSSYKDYGKELRREDIDLVSICSINKDHYTHALEAIDAGKHVLIEKPLCLHLDQLKSLRKKTAEKKVRTMVGHVARWYPAISNAYHNILKSGDLGEIYYGESDYWHEIFGDWKTKMDTSGSTLLMGGCHSVDLLRWFMGMDRKVIEVLAYANGPLRRSEDFDFPPNIAGLLKFEDGGIAKIGTSFEPAMPYVLHFQFMGTEGCIRNNQYFLTKWGDKKEIGFKTIEGKPADDPDVSHHPFPEEIQHFIDCVMKETETDISISKSYHTYELIFALDESARIGKPVRLPL